MSEVSIADFITDDDLLGQWFGGASWSNWLTVLKGAFGEPLSGSERGRFVELAEREPPKERVRELWLAIGRRGGKDSAASALATYCAVCNNYVPNLRPGERATIVCLACDREQAKIIFGYIRAYFELCELLRPLVHRVTADAIELNNGCEIVVATATFRGIRGRSVALAIMDEVAFWFSEGGTYQNPDVEIYSALVPALATLREAGAMIVGISTVHKRSGLLFTKWRDHHGQDGDVLVVRQPSRVFNPTLNPVDIERDIALDPARGAAEWLSEWRSDLQDYIDREVVEACVVPRRHELPPLKGIRYYGFVDAAGGSGSDSYTAAVAHWDAWERIAVLDGLREIQPKFSPELATGQHADFFKLYKITNVVGDKYAGSWPEDQFLRHGITYTASERSKSEIYVDLLPALNAHNIALLDNAKLVSQFCSLERKVVRGTGREVVDHGAGRKDDVVNAACGALLEAITRSARGFVVDDAMLAKARAYRLPGGIRYCDRHLVA